LASPTGQWPEAIHPRTKGGCMGDGQHIWASAEWVMMVRNCFVREEGEKLILFSGIHDRWLKSGEIICFGPAPTDFGVVKLWIEPHEHNIDLLWEGTWKGNGPPIEIHLPGYEVRVLDESVSRITYQRKRQ
jgi:hypothetical protein